MKFIRKEKVNIAVLVKDYEIYPRHEINMIHVLELIEAHKAGIELPDIIVDIKTNRIVDGFHRCTVCEKLKIEEISVRYYEYEDDKELLFWAINLNAQHGLVLSQHDRARCINIGRMKGLSDIEIAKALTVTIEKVNNIGTKRIRYISVGSRQIATEVKPILSAITKDTVTPEQIEAQKPFNAMRADYSLERSIDALLGNLLPVDENNINRVKKLEIACHEWLELHQFQEAAS